VASRGLKKQLQKLFLKSNLSQFCRQKHTPIDYHLVPCIDDVDREIVIALLKTVYSLTQLFRPATFRTKLEVKDLMWTLV
jgi:hypothetical protein